MDADFNSFLIGYTLATKAEEICRAFFEGFTKEGMPIESVVTGGRLAKNPLLMQIYADMTGREIAEAGTEQIAALAAAMLGAVVPRHPGGG